MSIIKETACKLCHLASFEYNHMEKELAILVLAGAMDSKIRQEAMLILHEYEEREIELKRLKENHENFGRKLPQANQN